VARALLEQICSPFLTSSPNTIHQQLARELKEEKRQRWAAEDQLSDLKLQHSKFRTELATARAEVGVVSFHVSRDPASCSVGRTRVPRTVRNSRMMSSHGPGRRDGTRAAP
jgi:hypothetical protein